MHIHILGICGTFMGGLAILARQLGYHVTGSDQNVYPPMSTQLMAQGIVLMEGYRAENLLPKPDCVIIGNALSRGNPEVEAVLEQGLFYTSGPQWLAEHVLQNRWVLAVAGTHGKTTTSSLLAWIITAQGIDTGFLIGGVPLNFGMSAQLGSANYFVIEADEYDSAFFDKRSKCIHYRPRTAIINNLEYDHADIFPDLDAIKTQFHHFVRTIPGNGRVIYPQSDDNVQEVLDKGCWTPVHKTALENTDAEWHVQLLADDGSAFTLFYQGQAQGSVAWSLTGKHNVANALAAIAAAQHIGIAPSVALQSLATFKSVKRRMEIVGQLPNLTIYDDFAHHPTAIATTLEGLRKRVGKEKIIAVLELRSNTMRMGIHNATLVDSLHDADQVIIFDNGVLSHDLQQTLSNASHLTLCTSIDNIIQQVISL
ncbi:MAG: UDP-N-acetylmuramate:L-alanyl-gamma-D-glutamyl-meso-diaminopimelate ligase, partial [Methylovulum sp.]|nr:UDP-N-acetylmuramate:L-alanyl-gamma-D-glutamyl-meso-diaminopimelate ligase [Methylovulum sp.]